MIQEVKKGALVLILTLKLNLTRILFNFNDEKRICIRVLNFFSLKKLAKLFMLLFVFYLFAEKKYKYAKTK